MRARWADAAGRLEEQPAAEFTIRPPEARDIVGLAALFSEMQAHYNRPVPLPVAMAAAESACRPRMHDFDPRVLLALADHVVAGSVVMNVVFPAFELTRALHIRDLYVCGGQGWPAPSSRLPPCSRCGKDFRSSNGPRTRVMSRPGKCMSRAGRRF
jgi:hypothetical protein